MTKTVLLDIETNGLLDTVTKIWCIVCKDLDTGEIRKFRPKNPYTGHVDFKEEFLEYVKSVDTFIGHNIVGYDAAVLNKILGYRIPTSKLVDTLVLSRLFKPVSPFAGSNFAGDSRIGGHSLEAWGKRLGYHKQDYNDWSHYNEVMLEYCVNDVNVTEKIYKYLMENESAGFSDYSIRLEHKVAELLAQQEQNGFYLDQDKAKELIEETDALLAKMDAELHALFPPLAKVVKIYEAKYNKDGTLSKVSQRIIESYGSLAKKIGPNTYRLYTMQTFNPQSPQQVGERLLDLGWSPKKFTDNGKPKCDKETLQAAIEELSQYPAIRALSKYNIVADRNQKARKWLELVREDGRVHGRINPIGAGTHRCSHFDDNMANIARVTPGSAPVSELDKSIDFDKIAKYESFGNKVFVKKDGDKVEFLLKGLDGGYGWESRSCWRSKPGWGLVGADASGIQLRGLAHYMNDEDYIKHLLTGDIHTVNQKAAGLPSRNKAKTFIYSWLMGAGDEKIGIIVGVTEEEYEELLDWYGGLKPLKRLIGRLRKEGRRADAHTCYTIIKGAKVKRQFLDSIPALKRLKEQDIPKCAADGYLLGLDGRKIWIPNAHLAMSIHLQSFEAIIMKLAMVHFNKELTEMGVPFAQVAFTHDEYEVETPWECTEIVGQTIVKAIRQAGIDLGTNCPLDGEYKIGETWAQVH